MDVILDSNVESIYLNTSINTILERLKKAKEKRPLVASISEENLQEFIAKHLFERKPFYEKAHHKILVDKKNSKQIILEIKDTLR